MPDSPLRIFAFLPQLPKLHLSVFQLFWLSNAAMASMQNGIQLGCMGLRSDLLRMLTGTQYMPDDKGWRTSLSLAVIPAVVLALGGWFLPETPNSLLERGKDAEARAILVKIRGTENVDNEYDDIKIAAQIATQVSTPSCCLFYICSAALLWCAWL
jgi:hypothetical protein